MWKGGAGSAVNEFFTKSESTKANIYNYGLPDKLLAHGSREDMLVEYGLDETTHSFARSKIELTKEIEKDNFKFSRSFGDISPINESLNNFSLRCPWYE